MSVVVKFGANTLTIEAEGKDVGEIREDYAGPLGMAGNEEARLNNAGAASDDRVLETGDVVEFVKPSGAKG